jgi:hypothetical protein
VSSILSSLAPPQVTRGGTTADKVFEEWPVTLTEFVQGSRYLANPPLSGIQYEAVMHAERIYYPETYWYIAEHHHDPVARAYWAAPVRMVNFLDLEWGKGSGKDHVARIAVLRACYLLLCLRSPQEYYSMPSQDSIHVLNVAVNSRQATRAFFAPLRKAVTRPGCWFQTMGAEVHERTVRRGRPLKRRPDGEAATALLDTIRFPKNIEAVSGHSDADSQEGLNLIMGVADEIDAFKTVGEMEKSGGRRGARESTSTAEAILQMLQTSASTRFETYKNIRISWPRYLGSKIQQLIDEGRRDNQEYGLANSRHYVSGPYATWEVNPRVHGKEQFAKDYRDDPVMSRARYECRPSYTVSPYFANELAVRECAVELPNGQQPLAVDYTRDGAAWSPRYLFSDQLYPVQGARYAMHADLAVDSCRAGVALAHVRNWKEVTVLGNDESGLDISMSEVRPVVKVDFAIGYEADKAKVPPLEIQIRWVGDLLLELRRRGFVISLFTADQWQSLDLQQRLTVAGIETDKFSLDRDETGWRNLRDLCYEGRLEFPRWELAIREILGLSRMPNGKIDHPAGGSKDIADAIAGACHGAVLLGGQEDDQGRRAFPGLGHTWGGQAHQALMPIGMPEMHHLSQPDDIIPEEVKDREMDHLYVPGEFMWSMGESFGHD